MSRTLSFSTYASKRSHSVTASMLSIMMLIAQVAQAQNGETKAIPDFPGFPQIITITPPTGGTMSISIPDADKTTVQGKEATYSGVTVTILLTPDAQHKLNTPVVTKTGSTEPTAVTRDADDHSKYTFTMPNHAVTVSVVFQSRAGSPLEIPGSNTDNIKLTYKDDAWHYQFGSGDEIPFNGMIQNATGTISTNTITVSNVTATPAPTLTLNDLTLAPTTGPALTVDAASTIILKADGDDKLSSASTSAPAIDNKGTLTVTAADTDATLTIHSPQDAIANTGILAGNLMEWELAAAIAGAAKDIQWQTTAQPGTPVGSATLAVGDIAFAALLAPGDYSLTIADNDQKGYLATVPAGKATHTFIQVENTPATYTKTSDLATVTINSATDFAAATHQDQRIIVDATGTLTIGTGNASIMNLTIQPGGQVILTEPLEVLEDFSFIRQLKNVWSTFSVPVEMAGNVESAHKLYTATGYAATDQQSWTAGNSDGVATPFTFSPEKAYLLAAEKTGESDAETTITFKATQAKGLSLAKETTVNGGIGDALANGIFLFEKNNTLRQQTLTNIYVLNQANNRFELKSSAPVGPMEAFIVANKTTQSTVKSLFIGGNPTANDQIMLNEGVRIWGNQGTLHISLEQDADIQLFTASGKFSKPYRMPAGDNSLTLPAGIYFIRCNAITYKVKL